MVLKFFNTLTRGKEEFKPIEDNKVRMYNCGPTVYNYPHIGNYRAYLFADLIKRYLKYKGYQVKQVMNITDVDDKTIRDSQKEGKTLKEFTEFYTTGFMEDLDKLNIDKADIFPKATETIPEMVDMIKILLEKGFAYKGDDGSIYFSIDKFPEYGKLAHIKKDELKSGARVCSDEYEKDNVSDFALWKAWDEDDGEVFWETELGKGRPGWHIECSAMSMKNLGKTFDIHTGGVDNMFPHHENEIAQSEAANGVKFVNYWMHNEHLLVDNKKMSKSLGNFYTLRDILDKGYPPMAVRFVLISAHYKQQLNFTFESLKAAEQSLQRLKDFINNLESAKGNDSDISKDVGDLKSEFEDSMDDDLNVSPAMGAIFEFVKIINKRIAAGEIGPANKEEIMGLMGCIDQVLGFDFTKMEKIEVDPELKGLLDKRQEARANKDFVTADKIRDKLKEKGFNVKDTPEGPRLEKI